MQKLAEEIGDLRYDALAEFLGLLAAKMQNDGDKDKSRGRTQLAESLHTCADRLTAARSAIDKAWRISEPYMK